MRVQGLRPAGVTLLQCAPPSRVTCTLPSEVPAQIMAALSGEGASAVMVPRAAGFSLAAYLPALAGTGQAAPRVRSGLMRVQLWPPLSVFHTALVANSSRFLSTGDQMMGMVRTLRPKAL